MPHRWKFPARTHFPKSKPSACWRASLPEAQFSFCFALGAPPRVSRAKGKAAKGLLIHPAPQTPTQEMAQTFLGEIGDLYSKQNWTSARCQSDPQSGGRFANRVLGIFHRKNAKKIPKGLGKQGNFTLRLRGEVGNVPRKRQESEKPARRFPRLGKDRLGTGALCFDAWIF